MSANNLFCSKSIGVKYYHKFNAIGSTVIEKTDNQIKLFYNLFSSICECNQTLLIDSCEYLNMINNIDDVLSYIEVDDSETYTTISVSFRCDISGTSKLINAYCLVKYDESNKNISVIYRDFYESKHHGKFCSFKVNNDKVSMFIIYNDRMNQIELSNMIKDKTKNRSVSDQMINSNRSQIWINVDSLNRLHISDSMCNKTYSMCTINRYLLLKLEQNQIMNTFGTKNIIKNIKISSEVDLDKKTHIISKCFFCINNKTKQKFIQINTEIFMLDEYFNFKIVKTKNNLISLKNVTDNLIIFEHEITISEKKTHIDTLIICEDLQKKLSGTIVSMNIDSNNHIITNIPIKLLDKYDGYNIYRSKHETTNLESKILIVCTDLKNFQIETIDTNNSEKITSSMSDQINTNQKPSINRFKLFSGMMIRIIKIINQIIRYLIYLLFTGCLLTKNKIKILSMIVLFMFCVYVYVYVYVYDKTTQINTIDNNMDSDYFMDIVKPYEKYMFSYQDLDRETLNKFYEK